MYRLVLIEDEPPIVQMTHSLIESFDLGFEIVGSAFNGEDGERLVLERRPDAVLTDIRMPVKDGISLIRDAIRQGVETEWLILTGYAEFDYAVDALRNGVTEYILKPIDPENLRETMSRVAGRLAGKTKQRQTAYLEPPFHGEDADGSREWSAGQSLYAEDAPKAFCELLKDRLPGQMPEGEDGRQAALELSRRIKSFLDEHYTEPVSYEMLQEKFGYHKDYLARLFRQEFGSSPNKYVTTLRIDSAKELIRQEPGMTLREIAEKVGYEDALYFSRVFKNVTGVSPSAYKESAGHPGGREHE